MNKATESIKLKLAKKEIKISSYFAFLTSILIAGIVILTVGYVLKFVKNISSDYNSSVRNFNYVVSSLVFQFFSDSYNAGGDYSRVDKVTGVLKANGMLAYAYAYNVDDDANKNRIIWSTEKSLTGKHAYDAGRILHSNAENMNLHRASFKTTIFI